MKKALMTILGVVLSISVLCLPANGQPEKKENPSAQDLLIQSEVETAVSMLQAVFTKQQQGEMTLGAGKEAWRRSSARASVWNRRIFLGRYDGRCQRGAVRPEGCRGNKPS